MAKVQDFSKAPPLTGTGEVGLLLTQDLFDAANIGPNRFHQNRTVSWQISIPRSNSRSSTWRIDRG
jgi:hypothetical protein